MFADISISRDVSKAKPLRGPVGHRGTRTLADGRRGGLASGGVGCGGAAYRLQELNCRGGGTRAAAEEGSGPGGRWGRLVGEGHRVGERRHVGEMRRVGDGDARR
jgi:hypothetical protein